MSDPVRRVVTGHDAEGKAIVLFDGPAENVGPPLHGTVSTELWRTFATPADNGAAEDAVAGEVPLVPPPAGSVFRIVEFAPDAETGPGTLADAIGAEAPQDGARRHAASHRTDSVDYAIILSGEIDLLLDDPHDDLHLKAGDVVVQRGTNHAWVNRGAAPCRIALVVLPAEPLP